MIPFAEMAEILVSGVAAAVLVLIGYGVGRRDRRGPKLPAARCSCSHGYGSHDESGACLEQKKVHLHNYSSARGTVEKEELHPCPCRRYDGPDPEQLRLLRGA